MKYIFTSLILLLTLSAVAQQEIKIEDAKNHVGDSVKICTKIFGGKFLEDSKGTPTFLNAGDNYPNAPLTIVIWADVRKQFKNSPEEFYKDKEVCIYGVIKLFKEMPEIVISNPNQLQEAIKAGSN